MIIHVTEEHIRKGERHSKYSCPVAFAILEQIPDGYYGLSEKLSALRKYNKSYKGVTVYSDGMIEVGMYTRSNNCPTKFLYNFDTGRPVKPFSFELGIEE